MLNLISMCTSFIVCGVFFEGVKKKQNTKRTQNKMQTHHLKLKKKGKKKFNDTDLMTELVN